ncbi:hypothetical protein AK812_SmicGene31393 [Symbiodinium microadriaticum]|uniref:Uncharacterized protein n=1 Tax=Symbiodinium microadriaticum TaxID=2951 RepID=A0A1Q9CWT7_SYMMI|nr:hypothetical protein AK812_SmicGene31393 [Symbiodinium microadriaticum]CAE7477246.1 unnamed protein product [Symbiodinium microadriaticum]
MGLEVCRQWTEEPPGIPMKQESDEMHMIRGLVAFVQTVVTVKVTALVPDGNSRIVGRYLSMQVETFERELQVKSSLAEEDWFDFVPTVPTVLEDESWQVARDSFAGFAFVGKRPCTLLRCAGGTCSATPSSPSRAGDGADPGRPLVPAVAEERVMQEDVTRMDAGHRDGLTSWVRYHPRMVVSSSFMPSEYLTVFFERIGKQVTLHRSLDGQELLPYQCTILREDSDRVRERFQRA